MKWNIVEVKSKLITVGLTQQIIILDFMESVISQKTIEITVVVNFHNYKPYSMLSTLHSTKQTNYSNYLSLHTCFVIK